MFGNELRKFEERFKEGSDENERECSENLRVRSESNSSGDIAPDGRKSDGDVLIRESVVSIMSAIRRSTRSAVNVSRTNNGCIS